MAKDRSGGEHGFKLVECSLSVHGPVKFPPFFEQGRDRNDDAGITLNKTTIEIGKTEEDLDVLNGRRGGPIDDGGNSIGLHRDTARRNEKTKKADFFDMELTF